MSFNPERIDETDLWSTAIALGGALTAEPPASGMLITSRSPRSLIRTHQSDGTYILGTMVSWVRDIHTASFSIRLKGERAYINDLYEGITGLPDAEPDEHAVLVRQLLPATNYISVSEGDDRAAIGRSTILQMPNQDRYIALARVTYRLAELNDLTEEGLSPYREVVKRVEDPQRWQPSLDDVPAHMSWLARPPIALNDKDRDV